MPDDTLTTLIKQINADILCLLTGYKESAFVCLISVICVLYRTLGQNIIFLSNLYTLLGRNNDDICLLYL